MVLTVTIAFMSLHIGRAVEHPEPEVEYIMIPEIIEVEVGRIIETEIIVSPIPLTDLGEFTLTAYCSCEICCGKWALNRPNGIVYTASGAIAQQGITIAVDPSIIAYGAVLYIEGIGIRIAQDCGGAIKQNRIDVYFDSHGDAWGFGRRTARVWEVG